MPLAQLDDIELYYELARLDPAARARPEAQAAMQRQIPGASLRFFEGGHPFMLQDPAAFPAMVEFLRA